MGEIVNKAFQNKIGCNSMEPTEQVSLILDTRAFKVINIQENYEKLAKIAKKDFLDNEDFEVVKMAYDYMLYDCAEQCLYDFDCTYADTDVLEDAEHGIYLVSHITTSVSTIFSMWKDILQKYKGDFFEWLNAEYDEEISIPKDIDGFMEYIEGSDFDTAFGIVAYYALSYEEHYGKSIKEIRSTFWDSYRTYMGELDVSGDDDYSD